jgi:hypothetical protein
MPSPPPVTSTIVLAHKASADNVGRLPTLLGRCPAAGRRRLTAASERTRRGTRAARSGVSDQYQRAHPVVRGCPRRPPRCILRNPCNGSAHGSSGGGPRLVSESRVTCTCLDELAMKPSCFCFLGPRKLPRRELEDLEHEDADRSASAAMGCASSVAVPEGGEGQATAGARVPQNKGNVGKGAAVRDTTSHADSETLVVRALEMSKSVMLSKFPEYTAEQVLNDLQCLLQVQHHLALLSQKDCDLGDLIKIHECECLSMSESEREQESVCCPANVVRALRMLYATVC